MDVLDILSNSNADPVPRIAPPNIVLKDQLRLNACAACPNYVEGRLNSCRVIDDNHSDLWNCVKSRHGRFMARLFKAESTCERWPEPVQYHIPKIKTIIYTTKHQTARHKRVRRLMDARGFEDWQFHYGFNPGSAVDGWGRGKDYWAYIPEEHAEMLRQYEPPLLILEDDIAERAYFDVVTPPLGADMVYLGGGRGGDRRGVYAAATRVPEDIYPYYRYAYQPIDNTWIRIFGMWFTHAILHIRKEVMLDVAAKITARVRPIDTSLAIEQWRWNVVCLRIPIWWQDDGKHYGDTYDYAPPEYNSPIPKAQDRTKDMRANRQKIIDQRKVALRKR